MVHRKVISIATAGAQRSYAQHVGNELELLSIPGEDHGARPRKPRLFLVRCPIAGELPGLILYQAVWPGDAHGVNLGIVTQSKHQRHACVSSFLVPGAGLYLDHRARHQFKVLHSLQLNLQEVVCGHGVILQEFYRAILCDHR